MNEYMKKLAAAFDGGAEKTSCKECSRLFDDCAKSCASDALKYLYRAPFDECGGDRCCRFRITAE